MKFMWCEKVSIVLLFYINLKPMQGSAVVSPPEIVPVCSEDTLNLTCNTTGRFLEWSFSLIPENGTGPVRYTRILQTSGPNYAQIFEQVIGSTTFLYSRSTVENSLPLMSTLSIRPVSKDLNGTVVNCTDVTTSDRVSTVIFVIDEELVFPQGLLKINVKAKRFESSGVTVMLHWLLTVEDYTHILQSYHISVDPRLPELTINFTERTNIQLEVPYDISYKVTLVAIPLCVQNNVTSFVELYFNQTICRGSQDHNDSITAMDYKNSVTTAFGCASEDISTLNASTCIDNHGMDEKCRDVAMKLNSGSIGAIMGGVFASTVCLLGSITCTVIAMVKLVAKKGSVKPGSLRTHLNETKLCSTDGVQKNCKQSNDTRGLVYADIGAAFNQHPYQHSIARIELADDRSVEYAQLNHNLLSNKSSTSQKALQHNNNRLVEDDSSVCVDLDNLLFQLRSQVTSKWYQFGCAVGIESKILDMFAEQCTPEDCIVEMLDYWLRNSKEKLTWRDVAKALKVIELPQLAFGIECVYTTGKLPVEVGKLDSVPQTKGSSNTVSMANEELPPPVPPKDVNWKQSATPSGGDEYCVQQKHCQVMEFAVPALPPKPIAIN